MRLSAFGYDMDDMKARAWVESEMPLWLMEDTGSREWLEKFIGHVVAGAGTVTRLLTKEVKTALYGQPPKKKTNRSYELPKKTKGDYGFIEERFYRETEPAFYAELRKAVCAIEEDPDGDDPTLQTRESWAPIMAGAAMRPSSTSTRRWTGWRVGTWSGTSKLVSVLERALRGHGQAGLFVVRSGSRHCFARNRTGAQKQVRRRMPHDRHEAAGRSRHCRRMVARPRIRGTQSACNARDTKGGAGSSAPGGHTDRGDAGARGASPDPEAVVGSGSSTPSLAGVLAFVREPDDQPIARVVGPTSIDERRWTPAPSALPPPAANPRQRAHGSATQTHPLDEGKGQRPGICRPPSCIGAIG